MDFLTPILNVPANRILIKLVLVGLCVLLVLIALAGLTSDLAGRLMGGAIVGILVRIIQAEVNHVEIKDLLNKK